MEDVAGVVINLLGSYINPKEVSNMTNINDLVNGVKTAGKVAIVGVALYATKPADAALMKIDGAYSNGTGEYFVQNNPQKLPEHMGDKHNMVEFTLPAGYNQGVTGFYSDLNGDQWDALILADKTVFTPQVGYNPLLPGDAGTFGIISDRIEVANKLASARAAGPPQGLQFNQVDVQVPIPEPLTVAYLCGAIATLAAAGYKRKE
jgi:hypothetical protein